MEKESEKTIPFLSPFFSFFMVEKLERKQLLLYLIYHETISERNMVFKGPKISHA